MEGSFGINWVPKGLHTVSCSRVPQSDAIPPTTGNETTIWMPFQAVYKFAMATQYSKWRASFYIPDSDLPICTSADQLRAVRTPGDIIEGDGVALHGMDAVPACRIPHTQGAIFTATK